uniref:NADH-ubiquinone oxidoreductase chain 6 n=1 Tax=Enoplops potanini TaxID=2716288 RepID=A0A6G7MZ89_9HEMI|nr:NADH dehydrogenase subunit 6 [Enoplops potanini]QIJ46464.1 NADH dehydrogenase subunit 6 [Enoplops potanini]
MTMMIMTSMLLSFIFIWLKHPISAGILIILQTFMISMMTGLMLGSFWFSYIIMIMMLSGILVLFIYMASVASNEKFNMSIKLMTISIIVLMIALMVQLYADNELTMNNEEFTMNNIQLNSLFNKKFKFLTMMMVLYLFFAMITVSQIVNISEGPLRMNKK